MKRKVSLRIAAYVTTAAAVLLPAIPFAVFPMALLDYKTPSFWVGALHNHVLPAMGSMSPENPYRRLWAQYITWVCDQHGDRCSTQDGPP